MNSLCILGFQCIFEVCWGVVELGMSFAAGAACHRFEEFLEEVRVLVVHRLLKVSCSRSEGLSHVR